MSIRIRLVTPHVTPRPRKLEALAMLMRRMPQVELSQVCLDRGPASIEGRFDEALCAPDVIRRCVEAERAGIDACVVDCMGDPGVEAAREAVAMPVIGAGEASLHLAATLGHRFTVVTVLDRVRPLLEQRVRHFGLQHRLASVRVVDVPVLAIDFDLPGITRAITEQALMAIRHDMADTIVLGCTGFAGLSEAVAAALRDSGVPAPVVDPLPAAVVAAAMQAALGLCHSALAYPRAGLDKHIEGFPFFGRPEDEPR